MLNKFLALFLLLFLTIAGQAAVWLPTASRAVEDATVTYDLFHADLKSKLVDTTELESGLSTKANSADVYTKAQSDATLEAYTYSETEINTALGGKADDVEGGTENNIITLNGSSEPKDSGVGISSVLTTSSSIEDLADVDPMIPQTGQVLTYDNDGWTCETPATGGDMYKATYDTVDDGTVNSARKLDADYLGTLLLYTGDSLEVDAETLFALIERKVESFTTDAENYVATLTYTPLYVPQLWYEGAIQVPAEGYSYDKEAKTCTIIGGGSGARVTVSYEYIIP